MSKKIKIPAKFAFLTDGAYIPAEMWNALVAFTAHPKRDVRYYLCGFHLSRAMCAWQATNGHVVISCKLSPAIQYDPLDPATLPPSGADTTLRLTRDDLPAWLPAEGVTFMPPALPKGTVQTRITSTQETALNLGYLADLATILPTAARNRADFPGARFKMTGSKCFILLQSDTYNWATSITGVIMGMRL